MLWTFYLRLNHAVLSQFWKWHNSCISGNIWKWTILFGYNFWHIAFLSRYCQLPSFDALLGLLARKITSLGSTWNGKYILKGWETTFLITAFGLSEELSTKAEFLKVTVSRLCERAKVLWLCPKSWDLHAQTKRNGFYPLLPFFSSCFTHIKWFLVIFFALFSCAQFKKN